MKSRVPKNIGGAQNMNSMIKQAQKMQDLIISAINEAMADVEKTTEEEMNKITGGVALPGLF